MKKEKHIVVVSPEEFAKMDSSEICKMLNKHKSYYIHGETKGIDRCICKPAYNFWYRDNWTARKKTFDTFAQAKKAAKEEYGVSIAIYNAQTCELQAIIPTTNQYTPA